MLKIETYTKKEFLLNNDVYDKCGQIYHNKYNYSISILFLSNEMFYVYFYNDIIIGFAYCGYYGNNYNLNVIIDKKYEYSDKHIELLNYVINKIKINTTIRMSISSNEYDFYISQGFKSIYGIYTRYGIYLNYNSRKNKLKYILNN